MHLVCSNMWWPSPNRRGIIQKQCGMHKTSTAIQQNFHNLKVPWLALRLLFFSPVFAQVLWRSRVVFAFLAPVQFCDFAYLIPLLGSCPVNSCKSDSGLVQVEISLTTILGLLALIYGLEYGLVQASDWSPCLLQRRCPGDDALPGGILSLQILNDLAWQSVDSVDCKQRRVRCVRCCL